MQSRRPVGARQAIASAKSNGRVPAVPQGPRQTTPSTACRIRTKSVRTGKENSDGMRVLVTRYSPYKVRGLAYEQWCTALAPSGALLRRYKKGEIGRGAFSHEYRHELGTSDTARRAALSLADNAKKQHVTLLFDTHGGVPYYHIELRRMIERPGLVWHERTNGADGAAPIPSAAPDWLNPDEVALRDRIIDHLRDSGFSVDRRLGLPRYTAQAYRDIQLKARDEQVRANSGFIRAKAEAARSRCRDGADIDPAKISLEIKVVEPGTDEADLFRWWNMTWWSMPYQKAYGRQIRLLLWDRHHDAPFGLVLLQSPVLRMGARDSYLGINSVNAVRWANMSMSAQRVGALPPYNELIGGKMTALAMTSDEVREIYRKRYSGKVTVMERRVLEPKLLFLTTTSAFGPSSTYDRLTYRDSLAAVPIGFTSGEGTFHLPDTLKRDLYSVMENRDVRTKTTYGNGPSRKIRIFKQAFRHLGLSGFQRHGIRRQVYLFPLATNLRNVIAKGKRQLWVHRTLEDIEEYWKDRWAIGRSRRTTAWKEFKASSHFDSVDSILGEA